MNNDRAYQYIKQALDLATRLGEQVEMKPDANAIYVSLVRNLESAEADLKPATPGA